MSTPGHQEEVKKSVQGRCCLPQTGRKSHSAHSAEWWSCHRSVGWACSPVMVLIPHHRLHISLLSLGQSAVILEYSLLDTLMPWLGLAVPSSESSIPNLQEPIQPLLSATASDCPEHDGLTVCNIINALGDVGSDSLSVLLEVRGVGIGGQLVKYIPICGSETVLQRL